MGPSKRRRWPARRGASPAARGPVGRPACRGARRCSRERGACTAEVLRPAGHASRSLPAAVASARRHCVGDDAHSSWRLRAAQGELGRLLTRVPMRFPLCPRVSATRGWFRRSSRAESLPDPFRAWLHRGRDETRWVRLAASRSEFPRGRSRWLAAACELHRHGLTLLHRGSRPRAEPIADPRTNCGKPLSRCLVRMQKSLSNGVAAWAHGVPGSRRSCAASRAA